MTKKNQSANTDKVEEGAAKKVGKRRTVKAGLRVPVPVAKRFIRTNYPSRVSADAEVALAACLEAIMTPIIVGAANEAGEKCTLLANDVEMARIRNPWTSLLIPGAVGAVFVRPQQ